MRVPSWVPSLVHSSRPWMPSTAVKKSLLPTAVRSSGDDGEDPCRMSLTMRVPAGVPSVFHSSRPWMPSVALKKSVPATLTRSLGADEPPGSMSLNIAAPPPAVAGLAVKVMVSAMEATTAAHRTVGPGIDGCHIGDHLAWVGPREQQRSTDRADAATITLGSGGRRGIGQCACPRVSNGTYRFAGCPPRCAGGPGQAPGQIDRLAGSPAAPASCVEGRSFAWQACAPARSGSGSRALRLAMHSEHELATAVGPRAAVKVLADEVVVVVVAPQAVIAALAAHQVVATVAVHGVVAGATVDAVRAFRADDPVVPGSAIQGVALLGAGHVGAVAAYQRRCHPARRRHRCPGRPRDGSAHHCPGWCPRC